MECRDLEKRIYFDSTVSPEMYERMRRLFTPYIWYRTIKENGKSFKACWCSACGGYFELDKSDGRDHAKTHREISICKCCGEVGTLICEGRMKSYSSLTSKGRVVFAEALDRNTVEFRCFYIIAEYDAENVQADIIWTEDARYILSPCEAVEYIHRNGEWERLKNPREPWTLVRGCTFDINYYILADTDELRGTFLEYADIDSFAKNITPYTESGNSHDQPAYMRYLCAFCRYPVIEYLMRYGCYDIIRDLIYFRKKHGKFLRWNAKKISDFCMMPKRDAIRWISEGGDIRFREWYSIFQSYDETRELHERLDYTSAERMCKKYDCDMLKTARYLIRQHEGDAQLLEDYWDACEFLGRDLANERVRYPKNLRAAHDEFTAAMNLIREENTIRDRELAKGIYRSETLPKYRRLYDYCTDRLCAMIPEQLSDIALEGRNMHHCVAGYTDRHAQGKTIIVFIRDPMYPLIPRWTAEISPEGVLRQVQGFNNRTENKPDEAAMAFIDEWLSIVRIRYQKMIKEMERTNEQHN